MKNQILLYGAFIRMAIRRLTIHRAAYFAGIVGQWLGYGTTFATLYIVVSNFDNIAGWKPAEVTFLYGLSVMAYAIGASVFYTPCTGLAGKIQSGEFDQSLTKPIHPLLHEVYQGFNTGYLGHFVLSLAVMIVSLNVLELQLSAGMIGYLIVMILGGALIQAAVLLLSSTASFFMINDNPILGFLLFDMKSFIDYPIVIFPKTLQLILTFVLPYAFINFYPAAFLFGKELPAGFPEILKYMTPVVGLILFGIALLVWNWGLSKYKSTGS